MAAIIESKKMCPSCRMLTSIDECKKVVSRSSGKVTTSWRCISCIKRKALAQQSLKTPIK